MHDWKQVYLGGYEKLDAGERFYFTLGLEAAMEMAVDSGGSISANNIRSVLKETLELDRDIREKEDDETCGRNAEMRRYYETPLTGET